MAIELPKPVADLLKNLNPGEKVNYVFDFLLASFIVGSFKWGNFPEWVDSFGFLFGLLFIAGCFIYSQMGRKLRP